MHDVSDDLINELNERLARLLHLLVANQWQPRTPCASIQTPSSPLGVQQNATLWTHDRHPHIELLVPRVAYCSLQVPLLIEQAYEQLNQLE